MSQPTPDTSNIEVEWQLDAIDLRLVERYLQARSMQPAAGGELQLLLPTMPGLEAKRQGVKRLVDGYLDTADWRIARSGHVLRVRQRGGRYEATLKDRAASSEGLRRRLEVTEELARPEVSAFDPGGPVGRRVVALAGRRDLAQVLEVRTRRNTYALEVHGAEVGELALDDTTIVASRDGHRIRLQRVEVEVQPAWVDRIAPLVERLRIVCGLQPATLSKFEAGILAAGVAIPQSADLGNRTVTAESSIGELSFAVLRKDAAQMLDHEPGTRLGDDPEDLHQMRVATRRMRAALSLFSEWLPVRAERVREELGWLAAVLGDVRDLDIQLERLDEWTEHLSGDHQQALDELRDLLESHHRAARVRLLEALDSRRYERLVAALTSMLVSGPSKRIGTPRLALVAMPELIAQRQRATAKAARRAHRTGVVADFHATRIRCKRLRYAIEFTGDLYPGSVKRYSKEIAGLQDALGLVQDAEAAADQLQALALGPENAALPPATIFAMGLIAERCRREAHDRLAHLSLTAKTIDSNGWSKAVHAMAGASAKAVAKSEERAAAEAEAAASEASSLQAVADGGDAAAGGGEAAGSGGVAGRQATLRLAGRSPRGAPTPSPSSASSSTPLPSASQLSPSPSPSPSPSRGPGQTAGGRARPALPRASRPAAPIPEQRRTKALPPTGGDELGHGEGGR
jgi:triphosphatase